MDADFITGLLFVAELVAVFVLARRIARIRRVFIADFQRGVRFVHGAFTEVVGPGSYRLLSRSRQIDLVDMRPRQFVMECVNYRDALRNDSFISIGGELVVADAYLSATKLKDQFSDSLPVVRDALRTVASRGIGDPGSEAREKTAQGITSAANAELTPSGMKLVNLEITEMWSRPTARRVSTGLN
jgi:hypothetical protein